MGPDKMLSAVWAVWLNWDWILHQKIITNFLLLLNICHPLSQGMVLFGEQIFLFFCYGYIATGSEHTQRSAHFLLHVLEHVHVCTHVKAWQK